MAGSHSLLSPSSAERWSRCPGSVQLCKDIPNLPNEASALGSAKHELSYWCLMHADPAKTADSELGRPWTADGFAGNFTSEDIEHVNAYLQGARAIPGAVRLFEQRLDMSALLGVPDTGGTADALIGDLDTRTLNVCDAKFGYGLVEPEDNRQLMLYAAGALHMLDEFGTDYDTVRLWIMQPKRGEPRMWETTPAYIRAEVAKFAVLGQAAMLPGAALTPGDKQCQWCPYRARCPARNAAMLAEFPIEVIDTAASVETIAAILNRADAIESWLRDARAYALQLAMGGTAIPGYKLIEGKRGNRKWSDAALVESLLGPDLGDAAYKKSLISPTDLERIAKKNPAVKYADYAAFIDQAPGAPSLAKWSEEGKPLPVTEFGLDPSDA